MENELKQVKSFDYEQHKQNAINEYLKIRDIYKSFCIELKGILEKCLVEKKINFHSIEARAKSIDSLGIKCIIPSEFDQNKPKYINPIKQITDLAGIRIITFFPYSLMDVDKIINSEFEILEKSDKGEQLDKEEKLGYQSIHYLIKLKSKRFELAEYKRFDNLIAEIQVRTILQHAWAEIEHDIEYKSFTTIPTFIKKRFRALAGLIEIADREFQSIHDDDIKLRNEARQSVLEDRLEEIEITPDSLKAYLDKRLGVDGRMTDVSYSYETRYLLKMGFSKLKQIDDCIKDYNDDNISRILEGSRQGQINRFDFLLLAGMGENFINIHPYFIEYPNTKAIYNEQLKTLIKKGIYIKNYVPEEKK